MSLRLVCLICGCACVYSTTVFDVFYFTKHVNIEMHHNHVLITQAGQYFDGSLSHT